MEVAMELVERSLRKASARLEVLMCVPDTCRSSCPPLEAIIQRRQPRRTHAEAT